MKHIKWMALVMLIGMVSCKTYSVIDFEVLRSAMYSVPPEIASVVLVNNSFINRDNSIHKVKVTDEIMDVDSIWVDGFVDSVLVGFADQLMARHFFDTVYVDTTHYFNKELNKPLEMLSNEQITRLKEKYNVDGILSIDGHSYSTLITVDQADVDYYLSRMDASGLVLWRLVDAYDQKLLHQKIQKDTIFWEGGGLNINASVVNIPNITEAITELAFYLGDSFADEVSPKWQYVNRKLYTSGSSYFIAATEWLNKGNRDEAEKIWGFIYEQKNKLNKARSAHNIAVSLEQRGDFKLALEWAFKSYESFKMLPSGLFGAEIREALVMYQEMAVREREQKKIIEQVGGEQ